MDNDYHYKNYDWEPAISQKKYDKAIKLIKILSILLMIVSTLLIINSILLIIK